MSHTKRILAATLAAVVAAPAFVFLTATVRADDKPAASAHADHHANALTAEEQKAGFKLLFDGRSMDHFRAYGGGKVKDAWQVKDGAIVLTKGGGGDIVTKDQYEAFELLIDYKISKGGNSGIMFGVAERKGEPPYATGPEIQVQDNVDGHDPQKAGWLYQLYPAMDDPKTGKPVDATKPVGEWNTLRIVINKAPAKSEIYMNGVKYNEFVVGSDDWKDKIAKSKFKDMKGFGAQGKGHIDLQDHGNEVAYRNIKIREIK